MSLQRIPPLSPFEEHPTRRVLIEAMRTIPVGEVMSYADLSKVAGEDVREVWHLVTSAREVLLKEGVVFGVVRKVGIKRASDDLTVTISEGFLGKVKRAARRSVRHLHTAHFDSLSDDAKRRYGIAEVRAGVVLQFSARRVTNRLAQMFGAGTSPRELKRVVDDTLAQFK